MKFGLGASEGGVKLGLGASEGEILKNPPASSYVMSWFIVDDERNRARTGGRWNGD